MIIRIVNEDFVPRLTRHEEFQSIDELFNYLTNTSNSRKISISRIGDIIDCRLWIVYLRTPRGFLDLCQKDGVCGICLGKVNKEGNLRQFNLEDDYESGFVYCDGCGRKIGKRQSHSMVDIFNECANKLNIEHKFTPLPIECGHCQGTGQIEMWDVYYSYGGENWHPTGKFEPCSHCNGKKEFLIEQDLMWL